MSAVNRFSAFSESERAALAQGMRDLAHRPGHLAVSADALHDEVQRLNETAWTIEIGGDDSWDTARRLLGAIEGWRVEINRHLYDIMGVDDKGVTLQPIRDDRAYGEEIRVAAVNLTTIRTT